MKKHWTPEEIDLLKALYGSSTTKGIADRLGRSVKSVYIQACLSGLKKDRDFIASMARARMLNPDHGARRSLFPKGHVPHNAGKKQVEYMSAEAIQKTRKTCFKPGDVPKNHRCVGSERVTRDGYIEVKTAESRRWVLKHRLVWEQHHGAIPLGANIQFRDGNRRNCHIDNLYMIIRREQMLDNSGSVNLPDGVVAVYLSGKHGRNKEEIEAFKSNKPLIELKRNQIKLSRTIKMLEK